jgi:hypothetical protein
VPVVLLWQGLDQDDRLCRIELLLSASRVMVVNIVMLPSLDALSGDARKLAVAGMHVLL